MAIKDKFLDTMEIVGKTALSTIPIGGALATSVYDVVKGNSLAKRKEMWERTIEERITKLEGTLEDIGNNESFTTALIKATELAMRTASQEKMKYLANAVVNSFKLNLEEEKLIIFMDLLDKYTISHIKSLHFFYNPKRFSDTNSSSYMAGSPTTILFQVYPDLDNEIFKKIYNDLYVDGMVNLKTDNLNTTMTGSGMVAKRTTALGDEFLMFILSK